MMEYENDGEQGSEKDRGSTCACEKEWEKVCERLRENVCVCVCETEIEREQ